MLRTSSRPPRPAAVVLNQAVEAWLRMRLPAAEAEEALAETRESLDQIAAHISGRLARGGLPQELRTVHRKVVRTFMVLVQDAVMACAQACILEGLREPALCRNRNVVRRVTKQHHSHQRRLRRVERALIKLDMPAAAREQFLAAGRKKLAEWDAMQHDADTLPQRRRDEGNPYQRVYAQLNARLRELDLPKYRRADLLAALRLR